MAIINGTAGNDTIRPASLGGSLGGLPNATDEGDTINGLGGNDVIIGGAGDDMIDGGPGNDTIRGGDGNDTLNTGATITGNEFLYGEAGDDTLIAGVNQTGNFVFLYGGAGNDIIQVTPGGDQATTFADYADRALPIVADLAAGTVTVQLGGGLIETDTLINVRGIRGSTGNDTLLGSDANDMLLPGLGNNVIDGRGGFDSLRYMDIVGGVVVDMATGTATKGADGSVDTFTNIEGVVGTNYDDTILGDDGDNELRPLAGNDVVDGRGGYDSIIYTTNFGGNALNFSPVGNFPLTAGIVADMTTGIIIDPWGGTDTVLNIERVVGTSQADDMLGAVLPGGVRMQLRGAQGNDIFRAPALDTNVTVDYRGDPSTVLVNLSSSFVTLDGVTLAANTARDGYGATDSFVNIQAVRGSNNRDVMVGSARADVLEGEGGNDELRGGDGDDVLSGGAGDDILEGGAGNDSLRGGQGADTYRGGDGFDVINFEADGTPLQGVVASLTTGQITDPFGNAETIPDDDVEMLIGTSLDDDLEGKARDGYPTLLSGRGGDDTLRAGNGGPKQVAADYRDDVDVNGDGIGVIADLTLDEGQVLDTYGGTDTLVGITSIRGSNHDDSIIANAEQNWLSGEKGDDTFTYLSPSHLAGDEIFGGEGYDTIQLIGFPGVLMDYDLSELTFAGIEAIALEVDANVTMTAAQFGSVEKVVRVGGVSAVLRLADAGTLDASGGKTEGISLFVGSSGNDTIVGTADFDNVMGGGGNDTIDGGEGLDTVHYLGNRSDYAVTLNADGTVTVVDTAPGIDGDDGTDTLTSIERFRFRDGLFELADLIAPPPPENSAPLAAHDTVTGDEDTVLTGNVLANDSDADGDALTAVLVAGPANGTLVLNADGSFTYTPDADFFGEDSFTYKASDGEAESAVATVAITVDPVNDAPTAIALSGASVAENSAAGTVIGLLSATDVDGPQAVFTLVDDAGGLFAIVGNELRVAGPLDFEAAEQHAISVRVDDGAGGSIIQDFVIAVTDIDETPGNAPPVAVPDAFAGEEDTVLAGNVLANDSDTDGDALTAVLASGVTIGTLVLNADGTFTYTPEPDWFGTESFTYRVSDGQAESAPVTVTLTVDPVNDAPTAILLSADSVAENSAPGTVIGALSAVDVDGPGATFSLLDDAGGRFAIAGNQLRVAGALDYEAATSHAISILVEDGAGGTHAQDLVIGVTDVDETPPPPPPPPPPALGFTFSNGSVNNGQAPGGAPVSNGVTIGAVGEALVIESTQSWNNPKNSFTGPNAWTPPVGDTVAIVNFVDARVDFSNALGVDLDITLLGIKRGELMLADGDDSVEVVFHSNEGTWNNTMAVSTGAGNDVVTATVVSLTTADEAYLADNPNPGNGPFWNKDYDGRFSTLSVDLGEGDDVVMVTAVRLEARGGAGNDTLIGGARNDVLDGGAGTDTYTGGGGRDTFILRAGEAEDDVITDFAAGDVVRLLGFGPGASLAEGAGGAYTIESGGASVGTFFAASGLVVGVDVIFA